MARIRPFLFRLTPVIIIGFYSIASSHFSLPEPLSAGLAAFSIMLIPALIGDLLLTLGLKKASEFSRSMGTLSRVTLSWIVGSYFLLALVYLLYAFNVTIFPTVEVIVMILLFSDLFSPHNLFVSIITSSINRSPDSNEQKARLTQISKSVLLILIGLSSIAFFRLYQPYPTYSTSEFSYMQKPLQLIDSSPDIRMAENGAYPIVSVLLAVVSYIFNVHPLPVIWILAFFQSVVIAIATYCISKIFLRRTITSMIAAFLAMWVFAGAAVQNNPYVVSNANLQYVIFTLSLYVVARSLHDGNLHIKNETWLILIIVPAIIFLQRLTLVYASLPLTVAVLISPLLLFLFMRKNMVAGNHNQFSLVLLLVFTFLTIVHPFMAPLYIIVLSAFVVALKSWESKGNVPMLSGLSDDYRNLTKWFDARSLAILTLIGGALVFYLVQLGGILTFQNHFVLSQYLFGNTYVGRPGIDVGFAEKVTYFTRGNSGLVVAFFLVGAVVMVLHSLRYRSKDIVIVGTVALSFILYFFPEAWFVRVRYIVPLFVLVIAGGISRILDSLDSYELFKLSRKLKIAAVGIIFLLSCSMLFQSTTPIINQMNTRNTLDRSFSTFEPYEYDAGIWLRSTVERENLSNTIILSDPYTMNLMSGLTNINPPYKKEWVDISEYTPESLAVMKGIHDVLGSYDLCKNLKDLMQQHNASVTFVIVNGRTTRWLSSEDVTFVYTDYGIPWKIDDSYLRRLSILCSGPAFSVPGKLYIFKFNLDELESLEKKIPIASLYSAMYFEIDNAYAYATGNDYLFAYWNVTSGVRSTITTSYMPIVPLWAYIISGNASHLRWSERCVDFLYTNSLHDGIIVPFEITSNSEVLGSFVKIDYSLRFVGTAINLYELTGNSTYLKMANTTMEGLLAVYTNETTGLLKGDQYDPRTRKVNNVFSTAYLGDYLTLLYKMYQLTANSTYERLTFSAIDHLLKLQNASPTRLIADALDSSGKVMSTHTTCVVPADLISGFSEFYTITHNQDVLELLETQASAYIEYGFNSTLQRVAYEVDCQTGKETDLTLFESSAYATVGAYSWLYWITGNETYLSCAERTFDTYLASSVYNGIHVSKIDANNKPVTNDSSYYFFGKDYDLPYGFFWIYYATKNETIRSIFSDLTQCYLTEFKSDYGFARAKDIITNQITDPAPALPNICRSYQIAILIYVCDSLPNTAIVTCHQGSYYYGSVLDLDELLLPPAPTPLPTPSPIPLIGILTIEYGLFGLACIIIAGWFLYRYVPRSMGQSTKPKSYENEKKNATITEKLPYDAWCVCPKCGAYISADIEYCTCGAKLPKRHEAKRLTQKAEEKPSRLQKIAPQAREKLPEPYWCACPKCGAYIGIDTRYCPFCKAKLPDRQH